LTSLPVDVLPGTASPRVSSGPQAGRSEGDDAAWLASSYGLVPDPWQVEVLRKWLGVADGGRYASARCGTACPRQNGKNGVLEVRELYGMVALGERILHTAHEVKTARKAFARLLEFFDNARAYPELAGMVREIRRTNGQEAIVLRNGGSVEFVARSRGSGRGFSVDVLVCDEAQEMDEDAYAALRPTVSASANPQVILTGTPPPPGASGEVFRRFRAAAVTASDARLAWDEWSCVDDLNSVDLDDRLEWAARNPSLGVRLQEQTVADERAEMDPEIFARERLGWWKPEDLSRGAISLDLWKALHSPAPPWGSRITFSLDVAPDHSTASIAAAWATAEGSTWVQLADHRPGVEWVPDRCAELLSKYSGRLLVEQTGTAAFLLPRLTADGVPRRFFTDACSTLDAAVQSRALRHGNQPELNAAVGAARWSTSGEAGQRILSRKTSQVSPLVAVAVALHGVEALSTTGGWVMAL
jgi:hypothetical protein